MARLTDAQIAAKLIRAGCLPSLVEDALQAAHDAGQAEPTEQDVARDSLITERDIALAQVAWWYLPEVPQKYKRLLTARTRDAQPE